AASLRWDWRAVMATALVLAVALWGAVFLQIARSGTSANFNPTMAAILGAYVIVAGAGFAYYSALRERRHQQLTELTDWPGPDPSQINRPNLASLLAHCARVMEVTRLMMLWEEPEEPYVNVVVWQNSEYKHTREMSGAFGSFVSSRQY